MKKLLALLLVLAMLCSLMLSLTACEDSDWEDDEDISDRNEEDEDDEDEDDGKDDDKGKEEKPDPNAQVTLKVVLPWPEQKDTDSVLEAINEKLETLLPNTQIEWMLDENFENKWNLWMASKQQIDLAWAGYRLNMAEEVSKEAFLSLDELVAEYAPHIQQLQKDYWYRYDSGVVNGTLYAIPNIMNNTNETAVLRIDSDLVPYMDITALMAESHSSDKTTQRFYELYTAGLERAEAAGLDMDGRINPVNLLPLAKRGYHFIGGTDSNLCYDNGTDVEIIDFVTTAEFETFVSYAKLWAQKGWTSDTAYHYNNRVFNSDRFGLNEETKLISTGTDAYGYEASRIYELDNPEHQLLTNQFGKNDTYWTIPYTAKHPERAMQFLDLLCSEEGKEILNLLIFGFEGTHYEVVDGLIKPWDYTVQASQSSLYGIPNWMVGSFMYQHELEAYGHGRNEYAEEYYTVTVKQMEKHPLYGCTFDMMQISNAWNKVLSNNRQYVDAICSGKYDSFVLLEELMENNKTAQINQIIAVLQAQAEDYLAQ